MLVLKKMQAFVIVVLLLQVMFGQIITPVQAETFSLNAKDDLQKTLDNSHDGDVITLAAGRYLGNFVISQQITLRGSSEGGQVATIDAQGSGHALILKNSHITLDNLNIVNWGHDLSAQNAGIYSNEKVDNKSAVGLIIKHNSLLGDGFGIWLNHVTKAEIFNNKVAGNLALRSADRGNGIQVSNVSHSHVYHNEIQKTRDGIYVIASQNNLIAGNTMHHLRYGIHYMYSHHDIVKNNTAYNTRAGYALMSSERLTISGNKTTQSEDYGFLLNALRHSYFTQNHVENVWTKPENKGAGRRGKGLFIYNSSDNTLADNTVDTAEIGIYLTAGSENIKVYGNRFINNPTQVKYAAKQKQEWSHEGRGNYWSNYLGWDMNHDGIGDSVFEPNDGIDKLIWQYPEMKMIMDSPAIVILRWLQKQFPVLKPSGVKDSYPLMNPNFSPARGEEKKLSLASQLNAARVQDNQ